MTRNPVDSSTVCSASGIDSNFDFMLAVYLKSMAVIDECVKNACFLNTVVFVVLLESGGRIFPQPVVWMGSEFFGAALCLDKLMWLGYVFRVDAERLSFCVLFSKGWSSFRGEHHYNSH